MPGLPSFVSGRLWSAVPFRGQAGCARRNTERPGLGIGRASGKGACQTPVTAVRGVAGILTSLVMIHAADRVDDDCEDVAPIGRTVPLAVVLLKMPLNGAASQPPRR